jgi:hypothetical protein
VSVENALKTLERRIKPLRLKSCSAVRRTSLIRRINTSRSSPNPFSNISRTAGGPSK